MSLKTQIYTHREQCEGVMNKHANIKYIFSYTLILYKGDIQIRRYVNLMLIHANTIMEDAVPLRLRCVVGK